MGYLKGWSTLFTNKYTMIGFFLILMIGGAVWGLIYLRKQSAKKRQAEDDKNAGLEENTQAIAPKVRTVAAGKTKPLTIAEKKKIDAGISVIADDEAIEGGKFLTNVFRINHGYTELVPMFLTQSLGTGLDREPAVPFKGRWMAIEKKDDKGNVLKAADGTVIYHRYDPREQPVYSQATPWDCFDATHVEEKVDAVYTNKSEFQEKLSLVIIVVAIILNAIVCLVALGKIG